MNDEQKGPREPDVCTTCGTEGRPKTPGKGFRFRKKGGLTECDRCHNRRTGGAAAKLDQGRAA